MERSLGEPLMSRIGLHYFTQMGSLLLRHCKLGTAPPPHEINEQCIATRTSKPLMCRYVVWCAIAGGFGGLLFGAPTLLEVFCILLHTLQRGRCMGR